jgi:hypothetical protein
MKDPLYWLLVSDEDKPTNRRLSRSPSVWLFLIGNAVWGLACIACIPAWYGQSHDDKSLLVGAVRWVGALLATSLPTVFVTFREADKGDRKGFVQQFYVSVFLGTILTMFSAFGLELILTLLGVRDFLGIPIGKWSWSNGLLFQ